MKPSQILSGPLPLLSSDTVGNLFQAIYIRGKLQLPELLGRPVFEKRILRSILCLNLRKGTIDHHLLH